MVPRKDDAACSARHDNTRNHPTISKGTHGRHVSCPRWSPTHWRVSLLPTDRLVDHSVTTSIVVHM
jgi:hypothetical protein